MLSDHPAVVTRKSPKRRAVDASKCRWSDSQKLEAVQTYILLGGNHNQTSKVLNIPTQTLHVWRRSEWWHEIEREIRTQETLTLSAKLKNIVDKSLLLVEDRLDKGDFYYDQKTGQVKRKPVSLKDVHMVARDLMDRREKINVQSNYTVDQENIGEKLSKLAKAFEEFANKEKVVVEVTDVIYQPQTLEEK